MRGLAEIRKINENPHEARADDALFAGRHRDNDRDAQRFHGERVEARQAERAWDGTASHARAQNVEREAVEALLADLGLVPGRRTLADRTKEQNARKAMRALDELFFTALIASLVAGGKPKEPEHQERIHSAIDAEPPFFKFWQKLNDHRAEQGLPEAGYPEAREAFSGGPTPVGAMTFIGKQWDGLRAVPAEPVKYLGGARPAYHGEYRIVSDEGTVWHKVVNEDELPIVYKIPEAAVTAAEHVRNKNFAKEHH